MTPGVRRSLISSAVLVALIAVAGCSHYLLAERDPWRQEAELACLNAGVPQAIPGRVRISPISGPGACGIDYPLKVSELGVGNPLGYDDEPPVPPSAIPAGSAPQQWPVIQSRPLPPPEDAPPQQTAAPYGQPQYGPPPYDPPQYGAQPYGQPPNVSPSYRPAPYGAPQAGAPMSLTPPGFSQPAADDPDDADDSDAPGGTPHPYYNAPGAAPVDVPSSLYSPRPMMAPPAEQAAPANNEPIPPLGPPAPPVATAGPVQVQPAATLACPIVSALDKWISEAVQPAALKWFRQPVVEIKQISAYSCRGMNGDPNAHISEHAFGNALDVAEFDLADGHKVSVQYGWHGTPEEQGFLHDVQGAACQDFTTVLAPGANVYHYNHIHVDLMRRASRRYICEPSAIAGEVAAARARERYAAQHYGRPDVTGSIKSKQTSANPAPYSGDDDQLPLAVPGDD
jgi:hypothetical protein